MIELLCICGAGTMGSGIAQAAATHGIQAILYDLDAAVLACAATTIDNNLQRLVEKNKLSSGEKEAIDKRLQFTTTIGDCVAPVIIEAVVEKLEIKWDLLTALAAINPPTTILASNTSSLSITAIAEKIPGPQRVIGMHFFNPAPIMKLVEVVETRHTRSVITQQVMELARQMNKTPVLCRDAPGFIVNHVARPFYLEALYLVEQGKADVETIDRLMEASGFKMGPFRLMDLIGNDINYAVTESVYKAMGEPLRLAPSALQLEKVNSGELGKKTGKGYYQY